MSAVILNKSFARAGVPRQLYAADDSTDLAIRRQAWVVSNAMKRGEKFSFHTGNFHDFTEDVRNWARVEGAAAKMVNIDVLKAIASNPEFRVGLGFEFSQSFKNHFTSESVDDAFAKYGGVKQAIIDNPSAKSAAVFGKRTNG